VATKSRVFVQDVNKISFDHKMKSLIVCCFKTLVTGKAECTLAMGKDKKRKLFGVTFSFNKEKTKVLGKTYLQFIGFQKYFKNKNE